MTLFDRYLLRTFLRVLLVSFISLTGLYIIIDLFGNLDELLAYVEREGGLLQVIASYYGARVLSFFDRTSGLLALLATIFTITWFQRSNELTAVMAAGISKSRIVRPLIAASVVVAALAAANRELGLPPVRDKLSRNAQDWRGEHTQRLTPRRDNRTRILIAGRATLAAQRQVVQPSFRLPATFAAFGRQLVARDATYEPAGPEHPGGYLLNGVTQPANIAQLPSGIADDQPVILTPRDYPWLTSEQCFVVSDVTFEHLGSDAAWRQYASTAELLSTVRNPSLDYGADTRVELHRRIVQPLLDVTLLFLGIPLVLARSSRNVFVAAAQCLLLMLAFVVIVLACQTMGNTVLVSPALAAWLPLMIFMPPAYVAAARRWE
jgi:lipopolysaccharide export system permease protein